MSGHYSSSIYEDDLENPLLFSSPRRSHKVNFRIVMDVILHWLICFVFLILSLLVLLYITKFISTYKVLKAPKSHVNSVFVSSFDVSNSTSETKGLNWDIALSLYYPFYPENYKLAYVKYTARAWLFHRNGFVSSTRISAPPTIYEGRELLVHANFTTLEKNIVKDFARKLDTSVDFLVEANVTRKFDDSELVRRAFVMIDCNDLKIKFPLNQSEGRLSDGSKSCKVQICATKLDAFLYGKEC